MGLPSRMVQKALNSFLHRPSRPLLRNATFIASDVKKAVQRLKDEGGGDLTVHGSITLARWLIAEGLLDELRLLVYPIVVGKGRRLFEGKGLAAEFEIQSSHATSNGVLALVYRPKKT